MPFMMTVLLKHESAENSWNMLGKFFFWWWIMLHHCKWRNRRIECKKKKKVGKRNCLNILNDIHRGNFLIFNDLNVSWCVPSCFDKVYLNILRKLCQADNFFWFHPSSRPPNLVRHWQKWGNDVLISWCLLMNFSRRLFLHMENISMCYHPFFKNGSTMCILSCKYSAIRPTEGRGKVRSCRNCKICIWKITRFKTCSWNN